MFGTFRFILATLVALSHFGLTIAGFSPGQWAVVAFYALSGFLMDKQVKKLCHDQLLSPFYKDRVLRIFPLYLAVLLLASPFFIGTLEQYIQNIALIPLNYSTFTNVPIAVGPAWSLACEFQFYLLVPFLARLPKPALRFVAALSAVIFSISPILNHSTFWGYTGLAGILFVFCSGMLLSRKDIYFLKAAWGLALALLIFFLTSKACHWKLPVGIHINVMAGFILFLPVIYKLSFYTPKVKLDRALGLFSYPLFLCHEPLQLYANKYFHLVNPIELLALSIFVASLLIITVELPFDHLRYGMRKRVNANP